MFLLAHWNRYCKYYRPWMLDAAVGTVLVPYGSFLRFLATCGCLRGKEFYKSNFFGSMCSRCIDSLGGMSLSTITCKYVCALYQSLSSIS